MAKTIAPCEITRLQSDIMTGGMEMVISIPKDQSHAARIMAENLRSKKLTITAAEYRKKRTIEANNYFWLLCGKLASITRIGMDEIYREYIKNIGDNFEIVPVKNEAKEKWIKNWSAKGLGWICEDLGDSKIDGYTNVLCYYGSSTYDSHQMYCLIEMLIFDCKEQGIETATPDEIALMMARMEDK